MKEKIVIASIIIILFFISVVGGILSMVSLNPEKLSAGRTFEEKLEDEYLNCVREARINNHPEILKECNNMIKTYKEICTETFEEKIEDEYLDCVSSASINNHPELLKECHMIIKTYKEICP